MFARLQFFKFLSVVTLQKKTRVYLSPAENEETLQRIFVPLKPFATAPEPLTERGSPCEQTCPCVVEDILSICCEL
jgi:hypothetical protein